jgi:DNA-binding NarL/FixJ family response regulator
VGDTVIVGRDDELQHVRSFVDAHRWPGAVVVCGEPGIGTTTVWDAGLGAAGDAGIRSMVARPTELDAGLPLSTLADLCVDLLEELAPALPEPQRKALSVALLREDGRIDLRSVSAGFLSLVRAAAASDPLLIAIDDAHDVDPSSDRVLSFALRRLGDVPVGVLVAVRGEPASLPAEIGRAVAAMDGVVTIELGPLDAGAIGEIVAERTGEAMPSRLLAEVHSMAGGNPFFALELARSIRRGEDRPTGATLPVPRTLRDDVVRRRSGELSPAAAETLLVAAAVARPRTPVLQAALPEVPIDDALDEGVVAGLVTVSRGEVRFTHPVFRSAIYADASRAHRHRIHATLADVVRDRDERARHLALSTDVQDEAVASEIAAAAARAGARDAPELAVELWSHAVRLTPADDADRTAERFLALSRARFRVLDASAADDALRAAERAPADALRATALTTAAEIERWTWRLDDARAHLDEALGMAHGDDALEAAIRAELFWTESALGDLVAASAHAERALALGRSIDDVDRRARAYAAAAHAAFLSEGTLAEDLMAEAPELWGPVPASPVLAWPLACRASELDSVGDTTTAREIAEGLLARAEEHGDEPSRVAMLGVLATIDVHDGRWDAALRGARLAADVAGSAARPLDAVATCAWLEAMTGERATVEADMRTAWDLVAEIGPARATRSALGQLATAELALGGLGRASAALMEVSTDQQAAAVLSDGWLFDQVDVLLAANRKEAASEVMSSVDARPGASPLAAAYSARARGAILAATGDLDEAEATSSEARAGLTSRPFDQARASLELGAVRRRLGHKHEARDALNEARKLFEQLGAAPWIARVDEELGHITGRRRSMGTLTDAEQRVARLAASGLRNREIADQLVMSVRTVEGHLSSVYAKVGVRSRTELALFFDAADGPSDDG